MPDVRSILTRLGLVSLLLCFLTSLAPPAVTRGVGDDLPDHLVISEVVTGGTSAVDELIELYNPTASDLPLEGLELIYVSASGITISKRAAWELGAPSVPPGAHVLVAHADGLFAPIADATYTTGMAATGGSVALRITGASSPIDGVGWGNATGPWMEGAAASAPPAGASIERLPGGAAGSTRDTDDNATDFAIRDVPEPQNLASAPVPDPDAPPPTPTSTPTQTPTPTATPTPTVTPAASTSTPTPAPTMSSSVSVAAARSLPNGVTVTMEGVALTAWDFHDGGGFVADASGGIAVLATAGEFARGDLLRVTGRLDDRFSQRTLRVTNAADIVLLGIGTDPAAVPVATGAIDESREGTLVRVMGTLLGSGSALSAGRAFDLDDGSGVARLVIPTLSGIDPAAWRSGWHIELVGVVGQRDSSGTGLSGYRIMAREAGDLVAALPPASASTTATPAALSSARASAAASPQPTGAVSIAIARAAAKNTRLTIAGVVTLPTGVVDTQTAAIQDATGAIILRLPAGETLVAGELVAVSGVRSTLSGLETVRVSETIQRDGTAALPAAHQLRTGSTGETDEATFVVVQGAIAANARRAASGSVSFDVDDGSGPLRVVLGTALAADSSVLSAGTWVEVRGVLGQQTTGAQPLSGYRLWPASSAAVRVVATATEPDGGGANGSASGGTSSGSVEPTSTLHEVGMPGLAELRVRGTLVVAAWPELHLAGLLWDGEHVVAIDEGSAALVTAAIDSHQAPIALELGGLRASGTDRATGLPLVSLGTEPGDVIVSDLPAAPPAVSLASRPAWISQVGELSGGDPLTVGEERIPLERRCAGNEPAPSGTVVVTALALGDTPRLLVPCGGIRAAPLVGRTHLTVSEPFARASETQPTTPKDEGAAMPLIGAALLLLGALVLGATAVYLRLRPAPDDEAEAPDEPLAEPDELDAPPRLTLVTMPPERGP